MVIKIPPNNTPLIIPQLNIFIDIIDEDGDIRISLVAVGCGRPSNTN